MNPFILFWLFLKASLFSTGGTGNLPILYDDLITRGWAVERDFAEALAIGQITPGPTGLWVISLGYLMDGLRGALLASIAICIPPLTILGVLWLYRRYDEHPMMRGFMRGLSLAVVGIFIVVLQGILQENGVDAVSVSIVAVAFLLALVERIPVILIMALAAVAGVLLYGGL